MSLVRVEHVSKDYLLGEQKVPALKDITLAIEPGVFLAIAGPSGSGKTTLLNLIGCIDRPTSGHIFVNEQNVGGMSDNQLAALRLRSIGFIFQKTGVSEAAAAPGSPSPPGTPSGLGGPGSPGSNSSPIS